MFVMWLLHDQIKFATTPCQGSSAPLISNSVYPAHEELQEPKDPLDVTSPAKYDEGGIIILT
jgi:hypothetical protein